MANRLVPVVAEDPVAPVWIAIALRAGTVAANKPPDTVNLNNDLVRVAKINFGWKVLTKTRCNSPKSSFR